MNIGRTVIILGLVIVVIGVLLSIGERLPIRFGRLPGDIVLKSKNSTFYFPVVTCILLSIVMTLIMWLINRFR